MKQASYNHIDTLPDDINEFNHSNYLSYFKEDDHFINDEDITFDFNKSNNDKEAKTENENLHNFILDNLLNLKNNNLLPKLLIIAMDELVEILEKFFSIKLVTIKIK